jgi:hypothetical protein
MYETAFLIFFSSFGLCAGMGEWAFRQGWGWRGELPGGDLSFKDYALTEVRAGTPDMYFMLYHGIGKACSNLRNADVLFLGNSHVLFALRENFIRRIEEKTGLKFFNMSLDGGDGSPFAMEIIKRCRLHPALVVVNEDYFFLPELREYSKETTHLGYLESLMRIYQHRISWNLRLALWRWLPRFRPLRVYLPMPLFYWRSLQDGALVVDDFPKSRIPIPIQREKSGIKIGEEYFENAEKFKKELESRGTRIILTSIPTNTETGPVFEVSRRLKIPAVMPQAPGLETFDTSHLTEESADRYSEIFLKALLKRPEIKELIRLKKEKTNNRALN